MKLKHLYEHALKKNIPNNVYTNLSLLETDNYLIAINSQSFNRKFNYWDTTNNLFKYHVGVGNNIEQIPKRKDFRTILGSDHFDDYTKIINKLKPPLDLSYFSLYKWYNNNIDYFKFLETSEIFADLSINNLTTMPFPIQDELTDLLDKILNKNYFGYSSWDIVPNEDVCDSIILDLESSGRIVHNNVENISFQIPIKMIKHKHLAADSLSVMYKSFVQTSSSILSFNKLEHHTSDALSVNVLYISK